MTKIEQDVKLLISVCSGRDWKPQFGVCYSEMIASVIHEGLGGRLKQLDLRGGVSQSLLSGAREAAFQQAVDGGYTHWATFDDDMVFPRDVISRLLSHDLDSVCANACRKIPGQVSGVCLDYTSIQRINSVGRVGLERISYGSMAVALYKMEKIKTIPAPHFEVRWEPSINRYQGEDHRFYALMNEAGIQSYCDHTLAQEVIHVGDFPYGFPPEIKPKKKFA